MEHLYTYSLIEGTFAVGAKRIASGECQHRAEPLPAAVKRIAYWFIQACGSCRQLQPAYLRFHYAGIVLLSKHV